VALVDHRQLNLRLPSPAMTGTTSRFERDTSVVRIEAGRYEAGIDTGWWIVAGPNGGYVAAIVTRAVEAQIHADIAEASEVTDRSVTTLSLHYLRRPDAGATIVEVRPERIGRTVSTYAVRMVQGERLVLVGLVTATTPRSAVEFDEVSAPTVPAPDDVPTVDTSDESFIPMPARYEMKPCLGSVPWDGLGEPPAQDASIPALAGGWIRLREPTPATPAVLAALVDAWWPPVIGKFPGDMLAVPTVDLTVHIRRLPDDPLDWVLAEFTSPLAHGGYLVEDARVFDRHGRLLATGRQLAVFA